MSNKIQKFESGTIQTKKTLPQSEETLQLNYLDGWNKLSEPQQAYLCVFFDLYPKKIKSCVESGIPQAALRKWKSDKYFQKLLEIIEQIHTEELEHLEYIESYTDSKVRGRYLKNKKSKPTPRKQINIDMRGSDSNGSFSQIDEIVEDAEIVED